MKSEEIGSENREVFHGLGERKNKCRKITKEEEEKKMTPNHDQAASRLLSGLGQFLVASRLVAVHLHNTCFPTSFDQFCDHFVILKHLKNQFNTLFMILNIQKIINSN